MNPVTLQRAGALLIASALAAASALGSATSAFADTSRDIPVTLTLNPNAQLEFEVPTVIPLLLSADGTLQTTDDPLVIRNNSVFGICVSDVQVTSEQPIALVDDAAQSVDTNAIDFQIGPEGSMVDASQASHGIAVKSTAWNMTHRTNDGDTDVINLACSGDANNLTIDPTEQHTIAHVIFTVAPGNHA